MNRRPWGSWFLLLIGPATLWAQQPQTNENAPPIPLDAYESLSARKAVRKGNALLLGGDTEAALDAYVHAENLRPDAPQIPFVQGLAHLARKEFDDARDLFRKAAASDDDQLAADALYSIGASYHKEALEEAEAPKQAIEHLEAAMERYRDVLARHPDHAAARESYYKAATMRRQLKQLLQQQQQQQQNQDGENQEEQEKTEDQQQSDSDEQEQNDQKDKSDQQQESDQQQNENQDQQNSDQQQDQQQEQSDQQKQEASEQEKNESEEKEQQAQAGEKEEEISREQAERRLREMMQEIRDKQKKRRQQVRKVPLPPVEKDW